MISDTVFLGIIAGISGILIYLMKILYSSKCKMCKVGCIEIRRDTDHEQTINLGTPRTTAQNPIIPTTDINNI